MDKFGVRIAPEGEGVWAVVHVKIDEDRQHIKLRFDNYDYYYNVDNIPIGVEFFVEHMELTQFNLWDFYNKCDPDVIVIRKRATE